MDFSTEISFAQMIARDSFKAEFYTSAATLILQHKEYQQVALATLVNNVSETVSSLEAAAEDMAIIMLDDIISGTGELRYEFQRSSVWRSQGRLKVFKKGDILYGRMRPNLNKCIFVADEIGPGFCSPEFLVLRMKDVEALNGYYLTAMMLGDAVVKTLVKLTTGSSRPRVQFQDLQHVTIPLAPRSIQHQIGIEYALFLDRRRKLHYEWSELTKIHRSAIDRLMREG